MQNLLPLSAHFGFVLLGLTILTLFFGNGYRIMKENEFQCDADHNDGCTNMETRKRLDNMP